MKKHILKVVILWILGFVIVIYWASVRAQRRVENYRQWNEYQECLEKNQVNPDSYICVPPKYMVKISQ